jgi:hypothetical protein
MRRLMLFALCASLAVCAFGQQAAGADANGVRKVLFVYEEDEDKLMPWIDSFREELRESGISFDECPAKEAPAADVAKYDAILIYGAVIAFASQEPVRDWLGKESRLSGKSVSLIVTANRWSLEKYYGQLTKLLADKRAVTVDSVSSATKKLSETDRKALVKAAVGAVAR